MPVKMTKAALNKLLIGERRKQRSKQRHAAFMNRTRGIYSGMQNRIYKHTGTELLFALDDFRTEVESALQGGRCFYCCGTLTVKNMTADHMVSIVNGGSWGLGNIVICCFSCQWQKGRLSAVEFAALLDFLKTKLSPDSATDVRRRLTIGGKWSPR